MRNRVLLYFPFKLDYNAKSGSGVRPLAIIRGFEDAGLGIKVISGDSKQRKQAIAKLCAEREKLGKEYIGLYAESSTMPMALTDLDHLPRRPFLDAAFFQTCRASGLPVALFYRDVHWRFPHYARGVPFVKQMIAKVFYHLEWKQIESTVDHLFLPSEQMNRALLRPWPVSRLSALPPGADIWGNTSRKEIKEGRLHLLYIGGVTPPNYDLTPLLKAVSDVDGVELTLCCRAPEWNVYRSYYKSWLSERVRIVHEHGNGLRRLYGDADAVAILWQSYEYLKFAMPVKVFEALGAGLPIITTAGTASADFVAKEGIGWTPNSHKETIQLLNRLVKDKSCISAVTERVRDVRKRHTWKSRAETVLEALLNYRKEAG